MMLGKTYRGLWRAMLAMAVLATMGMLYLQQEAKAADPEEWRPFIMRTDVDSGPDKADYPELYAEGRYGGLGYQYIQGASVGSDGTVLMGQDMGSARISPDFGKTWYTPPNEGNLLQGGNATAIDPVDSHVMFIAMTSNLAGIYDGIYRSVDKGRSWTNVQNISNIDGGRYYKDTFAYYPVTGGSIGSRVWWYSSSSDDDGTPGAIWKSTGGATWTKVYDLDNATYGKQYDLVQALSSANTLYLGTSTGLWRTTNGGTVWTRPWNSTITGAVHSFWIDPDDISHMLVSVSSSDTAKRGVWETTNNGSSWTRIQHDINTGQMTVGAKDGSGHRMIYVHNVSGSDPRIRNLSGNWITPAIETDHPDLWSQQGLSGQQQDVYLANPNVPDSAISMGRAFWWRSEGNGGANWVDSSTDYFGPQMRGVHFDTNDWKKIDVSVQDSGTYYTDNGGDWSTNSQITNDQWDDMKVQQPGKIGIRSARSITRLPDPWPSGAPSPVHSGEVGRRIMTLGGNFNHFIFTQNEGQTTWTDWIGQNKSVGGDGINRNRVFYCRQNPNIVYAGPNVSGDGGTTWSMDTGEHKIDAMSYLNGNTVYSVNQSGSDYSILKSTNNGDSWSTIFDPSYNLYDTSSSGLVFADPHSDQRLYTRSSDYDVLLLKESGGTWSGTDLDLRGQFPNNGADIGNWSLDQVAVDWSDPHLIYVLLNIGGAPNVWKGTLDSGFTSATWEDITGNAPRITQSTAIFVDPVTGDLILGSGNGNFVYPAPDSWQNSDTSKSQYKRALWENMPLPIPERLMSADFNSLPTGSAPSGWTTSGTVTVEAVPNTDVDNELKFVDNDLSNAMSTVKSFSPQYGTMSAEFSLMTPGTADYAGAVLEDGSGASAVMVKLKGGNIAYKNSGGSWVNLIPYSANTWYRIKIAADSQADKFSLWINGEEEATNQAFNTNVGSISAIHLMTGGGYTGTLYVDNVYITAGFLIDDTFNGETTGSTPAGWTVSGDVKVAEEPDAVNKSAKFNDTDNVTSLKASRTFTAQAGTVVAQFSFMLPTAGDYSGLQLEDAGGTAAVILKTLNGQIGYKQSSGTYLNLQAYSVNTWYTVKVVADVAADTCTIYINGEEKATDVPLSSGTISSISKIELMTGGSYQGTLYIDNVMVSTQ